MRTQGATQGPTKPISENPPRTRGQTVVKPQERRSHRVEGGCLAALPHFENELESTQPNRLKWRCD